MKTTIFKRNRTTLCAALAVTFFSASDVTAQNDTTRWTTNGNNPTGEAFIGTTNNKDLIFKAYGQEHMRLKTDGKLGIKTNTPTAALDVNGEARFRERIIVKDRIDFGTDYAMKFTPAGTNTPPRLTFGPPLHPNGLTPTFAPCQGFPTAPMLNQFHGLLQSWGEDPTAGYNGLVSIGYDGRNGVLDVEGNSPDGVSPRLLLNYHCGRDIFMVTGQNGGKVYMCNTNSPNKGVHIGSPIVPGTPHANALLTVNGKIAARALYVTVTNWADVVFSEGYQIPKLEDVEAYYKTNKHLPEIPSESEVIENGIDVAEMNRLLLKKVEELTIYMVEQQKQMKDQQKQIEDLKSLVETSR